MPRSNQTWWQFLRDLFRWGKPYDEGTYPPPTPEEEKKDADPEK